jgi:hypothetical protein
MRDRLIELMWERLCGGDKGWAGEIADYLIANGVIVPPCKVGDKVYTLFCNEVDEGVVVSCEYSRASGFSYMSSNGTFPTLFNGQNIGKTVFLTKEEAEKALKGGAE